MPVSRESGWETQLHRKGHRLIDSVIPLNNSVTPSDLDLILDRTDPCQLPVSQLTHAMTHQGRTYDEVLPLVLGNFSH